MLRSLRRVSASEFGINVRRLVVGNGLGQAITLLSTLVVARLFDPDDFGVAALFLSVTMMVSAVGSLRYDQAVILPESDSIAARLLVLAVLLAFASAGALQLALVVLAWGAPEFAWVEQLGIWLYAVPLGMLLMTLFYALSAWRMRKKDFGRLAAAPVALSAATAGGRIGFGFWWGSSVAGLILGTLMGVVAQLYVVAAGVRSALPSGGGGSSPGCGLRQLAREYREFPFYAAPAALVKQIGENLPVLLLSLMFAPAVVGFYAVANRLIRLPVGVVSESLRKVYLQRVAQRLNSGATLRGDLLKVTIGMLGVGALPTAFLVVAGPWLFGLLLGDRWVAAGEYSRILAPWLLAMFAAAPASTAYIVLRRQSLWLRMQTGRTILMGGALYLPYLFGGGAIECLITFTIAGVLANVSVIGTAIGLCSYHDRHVSAAAPAMTGLSSTMKSDIGKY